MARFFRQWWAMTIVDLVSCPTWVSPMRMLPMSNRLLACLPWAPLNNIR